MRDPQLPVPPRFLRQGPLKRGAFSSALHEERTAARIGRWLGIAFATCFVTGLISHYFQQPPSWWLWPSRPVWGYRLSQGLHVATGLASIPLLLAKLWTVYPRLWQWPPVRSLGHAVERLSLVLLVGGALFQVVTGLMNIAQWYAWPFGFTVTHFYVAWITIGALLVHLAYKAPAIARGLGWRGAAAPESILDSDLETDTEDGTSPLPERTPLSRRGFLTVVGTGVGVVTLTTVGQTLRPAAPLALLAPRRPGVGPQGLPVNRTAGAAKVAMLAQDPAYALRVGGPSPYSLSIAQLEALPAYEVELPITCVEGWSSTARWTGVRVRDLLERAGAAPDASVRVVSLERDGAYNSSVLSQLHARDELTLLALRVNGERLALDHGYPARLIAPNRPGVLQTKWVSRLDVL